MRDRLRGTAILAATAVAVGLFGRILHAAIGPRLISYQALVEDQSGPIDQQSVIIEFRAFPSLTGGTQRGLTVTRNLAPSQVRKGHFSVELDAEELGLPDNADETFLEVALCSPAPCAAETLSPRQRITHAALAVSARSLGGVAYSEVDGSMTLRTAGDGSARLRAVDGAVTAAMRLESTAPNGDRTVLSIDDLSHSVNVFREAALATARSGITPPPRLLIGSPGGQVMVFAAADGVSSATVAAYDGANPATLRLNAGDQTALEIDGATRAAKFFGPDGVTAARLIVNSSNASRDGERLAGGSDPVVEFQTSAGQLELLVDQYVVDRWTTRDPGEFQLAPNRISGSSSNYIDPGFYASGVLSGGSNPLVHDQDLCPPPAAPCVDGANRVKNDFGAVVGGWGNETSSQAGFVGGGFRNSAGGDRGSFVGGGDHNSVLGRDGVVAGGNHNTAGSECFVGGGHSNTAVSIQGGSGSGPVVVGGFNNSASEDSTTVGGGQDNSASAYGATVTGGSGNIASGRFAAVPGGENNQAGGKLSFAAGAHAVARDAATVGGVDTDGDEGTFVWGDAADDFSPVARRNKTYSTGPNQFIVRARGGFWFGQKLLVNTGDGTPVRENAVIPSGRFIQTTAGSQSCADTCNATFDFDTELVDLTACIDACNSNGAYLSSGGTWTNASDRNSKENISAVDPKAVLDEVVQMPIARWNYKVEGQSTRHIGPMAQDFHAAFGLGDSDKTIATIDADGVALAAIQGLHQLLQDKDCQIEDLKSQVSRLRELEERLARMEELLNSASADQGGTR